jgi:hypothetical protein
MEVRMYTLHIEHDVVDFDRWKELFDSDPVNRQRSGVRRYSIMRSIDHPSHISIDLELERRSDAEALQASLTQLWERVGESVMINPHTQIKEVVESKELI